MKPLSNSAACAAKCLFGSNAVHEEKWWQTEPIS